MTTPLHHIHKRKNLEPYPHPNQFKKSIDLLTYAAGILGPILLIPQAITLYKIKDASGASLITWLGLAVVSVIWLLYGFIHKEKPIIITYSLFTLLNLVIVLEVIAY